MGTARSIWPMIKWSCGQNGLSSVWKRRAVPAGARIPIPPFCWLVSRMASAILSMRNASVC